MAEAREKFGTTKDGKDVDLYTLTNSNGLSVKVMTYGATIISIVTPDNQGKNADIVLGFNDFETYEKGHPYFGCIAGRVANRIGGAEFELEGLKYTLKKNNGNHSLHGGEVGFDKVIWTVSSASKNSVKMSYTSKDMEEGFPGSLNTHVTYTLTDKDELEMFYEATTDKTTLVNLTNHTYFNLAGAASGDVKGHVLESPVKEYTVVDDESIPTGEIASVKGTPLDFSTPKTIGARIDQLPIGYDHNLCVPRDGVSDGEQAFAVKVTEPTTGRVMEVYTTEPGIQYYSSWYVDGTNIGREGVAYKQFQGLCLETQKYPDAIHHSNFPSTVLKKGEKFTSKTTYRFSAEGKKRKATE